jgi:hypothetical protein
MEKQQLEELKGKVPCAAVLEHLGFALDVKQSTRRALKYRRDAQIIIVIHDGKGWFDPLSEAKGDVFRLVQHLEGGSFVEAMVEVADLVGFVPAAPALERPSRDHESDVPVPERWQARRRPWRGSAAWRYLSDTRCLPERIISAALGANVLREGPHGSMWAAHRDVDGVVTGWEERGPDWRGFATGGAKVLFRLGPRDALRLCVTEAAIDAMSLAALEGLRADSLYLSTGGGWSPATDAAIRALGDRPGSHLVAATDNNTQGKVYAGRLLGLARQVGCDAERIRPVADDWNADLKVREESRRMGKGRPAAACPPVASRVKLRPAGPAPDPPGGDAAAGGGVRKG